MKYSFNSLLIALCFTASALAATTNRYPECTDSCAHCSYRKGCEKCIGLWSLNYNAYYTKMKCGEKIDDSLGCLFATVDRKNQKRCHQCRPGYLLRTERYTWITTCRKGTFADEPKKVDGCFPGKQLYIEYKGSKWNRQKGKREYYSEKVYSCTECDASKSYWFNDYLGRGCLKIVEKDLTAKAKKDYGEAKKNCVFGAYEKTNDWWSGLKETFKCKKCSKGFAPKEDGKCIAFEMEGCSALKKAYFGNRYECVECDVLGGYYMASPHKCKKRTSSQ